MSTATSIVDEYLELEEKEQKALRSILDKKLAKGDHLMVQKAMMGGTESYVGSVSLEWLAQKVRFAHQLPLFDNKKVRDEEKGTERIVIDETTINTVKQRRPDWSRQIPLTLYLAARRYHKFPPVLVVVSQDWADTAEASEWVDSRAAKPSLNFTPFDSEGKVGMLSVAGGSTVFALDGQHRLMAAKGLMELISEGQITARDKDGKKLNTVYTLDDIVKEYDLDRGELQRLGNERIGIEFIAAVMPGETREEAQRRVRSIFVHVNRMAITLTKGQIIQLEEDNGFAIVSRQAGVTHPLLRKGDRGGDLVNWDNTTVSAGSKELTTSQALTEMATGYLKHKYAWAPTMKGLIPMRPEEEEIQAGLSDFNELLDAVGKLPTFEEIARGADIRGFRQFDGEAKDGEEGGGHMLLRPVGQVALAQALGVLVFKCDIPLEKLVTKLRKFDSSGGFKMDTVESLWYYVLYDPNKERILIRGQQLAADLLVYILGGGIQDDAEREKLRERLAAERTTEGETTDFDGKKIKPEELQLPPALR
ncbi:MAG TPA: DGQHR domain-containing protein [Pyrinomonadaceae bacterium]|nr:DGQHR domain-containing protein [Pyrinomonadaceae bacterium]